MNTAVTSYSHHLNTSLYWNSIDSIASQAVLILHYFLLSSHTSAEFYTQSATIFSFFYLIAIVINAGLSSALASYFETFTQSKSTFNYLCIYHLIPQVIFTGLVCAITYYIYDYTNLYAYIKVEISLARLILITFFLEGLKKTTKSLLQYALYFNITALTEFLGATLYVALVWLLYYSGYIALTFNSLWTILLFVSLGQNASLLYHLYKYYLLLPTNSFLFMELPSYKKLLTVRFFIVINQLSTQLFTTNFLMPLCVLYLGTSQTRILHLTSNCARWITLIAQKGFGISALSLFARTKYQDTTSKRKLFTILNTRLYHLFLGFLIFITINGKNLVHSLTIDPKLSYSSLSVYVIFAFLIIISILESFFVLYEKWYIVEEKAYYNMISNTMSFLVIYTSIRALGSSLTIMSFLALIITARLSCFLLLSFISFYLWNLKPTLTLNYKIILCSLLVSLIFYFFYF